VQSRMKSACEREEMALTLLLPQTPGGEPPKYKIVGYQTCQVTLNGVESM
jgi:hypothetical protein